MKTWVGTLMNRIRRAGGQLWRAYREQAVLAHRAQYRVFP